MKRRDFLRDLLALPFAAESGLTTRVDYAGLTHSCTPSFVSRVRSAIISYREGKVVGLYVNNAGYKLLSLSPYFSFSMMPPFQFMDMPIKIMTDTSFILVGEIHANTEPVFILDYHPEEARMYTAMREYQCRA